MLIGSKKQARVLLAVMAGIWLAMSVFTIVAESSGNPSLTAIGVDQGASSELVGGNLEGKEVRFGPATCGLWAGVHDRHVERLGQLHARQPHADRRACCRCCT